MEAPRVDLLGMQALAHLLKAAGVTVADHGTLHNLTLAGDLLSNSGYFGLVGLAPRERAVAAGLALGAVAGLGAVYLPSPIGLSDRLTDRAVQTRAITVALYTPGRRCGVPRVGHRAMSASQALSTSPRCR